MLPELKNSLIIDRARFDHIREFVRTDYDVLAGRTLQMLNFFIIEEDDGSATFIKNRFSEETYMKPSRYRSFRRWYPRLIQIAEEKMK